MNVELKLETVGITLVTDFVSSEGFPMYVPKDGSMLTTISVKIMIPLGEDNEPNLENIRIEEYEAESYVQQVNSAKTEVFSVSRNFSLAPYPQEGDGDAFKERITKMRVEFAKVVKILLEAKTPVVDEKAYQYIHLNNLENEIITLQLEKAK